MSSMDDTNCIVDISHSTEAFINEKIQLFQSDRPVDHCFKCEPSEFYKFFSKNESDVLEYSSNWFAAKEIENTSVDPISNDSEKQEFTYTDIGYKDNVPVFTTYKYKSETIPHVNHVTLMSNNAIEVNVNENDLSKQMESVKPKESQNIKNPQFSPYAKKFVTSRFGRKRKVFDFSLFEDDAL